MKHVNKRCPVCNSTIKLTEHSWLNYLSVFGVLIVEKSLKRLGGNGAVLLVIIWRSYNEDNIQIQVGTVHTKREIELMDFSGEVEELVKILENLTW